MRGVQRVTRNKTEGRCAPVHSTMVDGLACRERRRAIVMWLGWALAALIVVLAVGMGGAQALVISGHNRVYIAQYTGLHRIYHPHKFDASGDGTFYFAGVL